MFFIRLLLLVLLSCQTGFATSSSPIEQPPSSTEHLPLQTDHPPLPSSEEMTYSYQHAFVRMIVSLLGLLILVFGTVWVLRRIGKGKLKFGSNRSIQIVEKRSLSNKTTLYVVEIEGKQILLSESQLEVRALTTLEIPPKE